MDSIYVVGELALPFLCLSKRYSFVHYSADCAKYHSVCTALLAKARMRGCRLRWPSDMLMGDEAIKPADKLKCFLKFEPDARNEGADYDGEAKAFKVSDAETVGSGTNAVLLTGYAYDIGPETCASLKESLQNTDLVLLWGPAGVVESSAFQAGQQVLAEFGTTKVQPDAPAPASARPTGKAAGNVTSNSAATTAAAAATLTKNPLRTVLVGDSTVEWCTRLLDSDGELGGDLVAAGCVSYATRDSAVVGALLGLYPSRVLQEMLLTRPTAESELLYSKKIVEVEEEEDDEDEDDD
jgi:hypothetical protein